MDDITRTIADHGQRITKLETRVEGLAPKVEIIQTERRLDNRLSKVETVLENMATTISSSHKQMEEIQRKTEKQIERLAEEIGRGMTRLSEINEEVMTAQAKQVEEKHRAEIALLRRQIAEMEAGRWDALLLRWCGLIAAAGAAGGTLWAVVHFLIQHAK
jgi:chromosome segregation ATPase